MVGDLCRALEKQLTPFCPAIIEIFLQNLRNQEVHRQIKPHILACFGDVAFQIGGEFERFLHHTMTILGQAAMTTTNYNADDEELREHIAHLRESILDAYTGIVQGLSADRKQHLLVQPTYLQPVIHLLIAIAQDAHSEEPVIKRAIGLVGDLGSNLGDKVSAAIGVNVAWIQSLYKNIDSYSDETKKIAAYTKQVRGMAFQTKEARMWTWLLLMECGVLLLSFCCRDRSWRGCHAEEGGRETSEEDALWSRREGKRADEAKGQPCARAMGVILLHIEQVDGGWG